MTAATVVCLRNGGNLECARRLGGQLPGMWCLGLVTGPGVSLLGPREGRLPATRSRAFLTVRSLPGNGSWSGEGPVRSLLPCGTGSSV
jgi:hypothetical protein